MQWKSIPVSVLMERNLFLWETDLIVFLDGFLTQIMSISSRELRRIVTCQGLEGFVDSTENWWREEQDQMRNSTRFPAVVLRCRICNAMWDESVLARGALHGIFSCLYLRRGLEQLTAASIFHQVSLGGYLVQDCGRGCQMLYLSR